MVRDLCQDWTFQYFPDSLLDEHPAQPVYDDVTWPAISLPHSWQSYETTRQLHPFILNASETGKGYFGGTLGTGNNAYWWEGWGWYRKKFELIQPPSGRRLFLEFDGVMKHCRVYLNGQYLGDHKGGFNAFCFDITDILRPEGTNTLAVAVRNKQNDPFRIPPMHSGNQNHSGGIYRKVRLVMKNPVHIPFQGSAAHEGGTFVTTPVARPDSAVIRVRTWVKNHTFSAKEVHLKTILQDAGGREMGSISSILTTPPGRIVSLDQVLPALKDPALWSPSSPNLYKVVSLVLTDDTLSDRYESPLGIRTFEWDYRTNTGILNGKHIHIHGTNRTQAYPWLNNAIPEWIDVMDVRDIRFGLGHNFIRPNIHPNNPLMHDLFDQWGMLVNLGAPMIKDIDFSEEVQQQMMVEAVRRHRNRPGIVFYSVGNETTDGADSRWIYREDSTRIIHARYVTGGAGNFVRHDHTHMDMENLLRVTIRGWTHDEVFPERPENGQHAGNEEWQHERATVWDGSIRGRIDMPNGVMWMYSDDGAARIYRNAPLKNTNPKGWVDAYRVPKYLYFLWQAHYTDAPMVFIHPHFWQRRHLGTKQDIVVDSNCDSVILAVDDRKVGTRYPSAENFQTVVFEGVQVLQGILSVTGMKENGSCRVLLPMAGEPLALRLVTSHNAIPALRSSILAITLDAVDDQGIQVQGFKGDLHWEVEGPARLVGPAYWETDIQKNNADSGTAYIVAPVVNLVRSTGEPGMITVRASSPGLSSAVAHVEAFREEPCVDALIREFPLSDRGRLPVSLPGFTANATRLSNQWMNPVREDIILDTRPGKDSLLQSCREFILNHSPRMKEYPELVEEIASRLAGMAAKNNGVMVADDYNFMAGRINERIANDDTPR